ncbi:MAG: disulfide bond formation protein B [Dichotomicrobium sp.]
MTSLWTASMVGGLIEKFGMREAALAVAGVATATIVGALAYEHLGGYEPCELCLRQRWAYYAGIPAALLSFVLAHSRPGLAAGLLAFVGVAFIVNAGLGVHHAGVEWGWWAGPSGCSGGVQVSGDAGALAESLSNAAPVRCDEPAFRFLGLSFAGYNVLISAALAGLAAIGLRGYLAERVATA